MHPQSPPLTIGGTVLKQSDDIEILGLTHNSKMIFKKHLRSVSRAASQRLGILRKSWRKFHYRSLLGRYFWGFVLVVLDFCFAVWCSSADTKLKLLDRVGSSAHFLTEGVFVDRRSSSICGNTEYAEFVQMYPDTPSLCCSTCGVCASAVSTRCSNRTSVYLYASSLQNLSVARVLYFFQFRGC